MRGNGLSEKVGGILTDLWSWVMIPDMESSWQSCMWSQQQLFNIPFQVLHGLEDFNGLHSTLMNCQEFWEPKGRHRWRKVVFFWAFHEKWGRVYQCPNLFALCNQTIISEICLSLFKSVCVNSDRSFLRYDELIWVKRGNNHIFNSHSPLKNLVFL